MRAKRIAVLPIWVSSLTHLIRFHQTSLDRLAKGLGDRLWVLVEHRLSANLAIG